MVDGFTHPLGDELWARATRLIPGGSQTFSKAPFQLAPGFAPKLLVRGEGARVWDPDGHEYLDWTMGLLPLILGYCHPRVDEAVTAQLTQGTTFSLSHPLEGEVAERIVDLIPSAEMVRFGKNGSDATAGAVRLARAITGRDIIACCGYHGWQDWFIGTTTRSKGVPKAVRDLTQPFVYNDLESLEAVFAHSAGGVAAVIMEPVTFEQPKPGFLEGVRDLTHRNGALLIFDEIITGFRFALGGAQERFGIYPDLTTIGKALANGFPLSAIVGRSEVMQELEEVFFSFTFGGDTVSLAAARATLDVLVEETVPDHLERVGGTLRHGATKLIERHGLEDVIRCAGGDSWSCLEFLGSDTTGVKTLFQQECLRRGILFMANHNTSLAHGDAEIARTLDVYDEVLGVVASALEKGSVDHALECERVQPVFRKY